jgi:hypothetical protein
MTQDEIIEMYRKSGFSIHDGIVTGGVSDLERFAKLVFDWAYVAPSTWVGLTDDEIYKIAFALEGEHWRKITDAIEAKLKEKNT